ncbi:hypothetical protein [Labilibaculum sp.]|uniref:hypothetical protein n=1 Tax=Labilibaculum sp. TaxID=2060723 RepID=UPI002AA6973D|nr:hypothetical protein [Labilibaculum sp.]
MANKNKVPEFQKMAVELKKNASRYAGSESVKFFKESFVKGGFTDTGFEKWTQSSNPMAGKRTMYNKGRLMRSIKKLSASLSKVVVVADSEYADIHNKGGHIVVTAKMKKYFWAKFYELSGNVSVNKKGAVSLNKRNVSLGKKAMFCKAMALKPVGSKIKIPKHQFMGNSQTMMIDFDKWFGDTIKFQIEKQWNNPTINIDLKSV